MMRPAPTRPVGPFAMMWALTQLLLSILLLPALMLWTIFASLGRTMMGDLRGR